MRQALPQPVRASVWRTYYALRDRSLQTIYGCQTGRKIAALTFDDGPSPQGTPAILDVLDHYHVRATFFMLGRNVVAHPELARRVVERGHAPGNHTFGHRRLVGCSRTVVAGELSDCRRAIRQATGTTPGILRPPYGEQDTVSYLTARLAGYALVNWSVSGDDWRGDPAHLVSSRILESIRPGSIILLHDGWEPAYDDTAWRPEYDLYRDRSSLLEALPVVIANLLGQGYEFVTVPELMRAGRPATRSWFS